MSRLFVVAYSLSDALLLCSNTLLSHHTAVAMREELLAALQLALRVVVACRAVRALVLAQAPIKKPQNMGLYFMAVREGFEPSKPYDLHTFQACSFGHSDTSPVNCFSLHFR